MVVLEALALGVIVISADVGALGGLFGDHALLLDLSHVASPGLTGLCERNVEPFFATQAYRDAYVRVVGCAGHGHQCISSGNTDCDI